MDCSRQRSRNHNDQKHDNNERGNLQDSRAYWQVKVPGGNGAAVHDGNRERDSQRPNELCEPQNHEERTRQRAEFDEAPPHAAQRRHVSVSALPQRANRVLQCRVRGLVIVLRGYVFDLCLCEVELCLRNFHD